MIDELRQAVERIRSQLDTLHPAIEDKCCAAWVKNNDALALLVSAIDKAENYRSCTGCALDDEEDNEICAECFRGWHLSDKYHPVEVVKDSSCPG